MKAEEIRRKRKEMHLSQGDLAKMLGVHRRTVQNWESGGVIPDVKSAMLHTILSAPDNPTYIISGDGNIVQENNNNKNSGSIATTMTNYFNDRHEEGQNRQKDAIEETPTAKISYTTGRPYYNVDFIEGFDLVTNDQTINPEYNIDFAPYNKDGVVWCNITGNSMEPLISNGDIIALKPLQDWNSFMEYGKTYAIVTTNNIRTVKKIRKGSDKDHLLLIPENLKECDEQEIYKSMIKHIFLVIGCMKKL